MIPEGLDQIVEIIWDWDLVGDKHLLAREDDPSSTTQSGMNDPVQESNRRHEHAEAD